MFQQSSIYCGDAKKLYLDVFVTFYFFPRFINLSLGFFFAGLY